MTRVRKHKQAPNLDHIHPDLRHLAVEVARLTLDENNARQHPEPNLGAIKGSLKRFGQRKPLVVRKKGMIVEAGNGTLVAAKQLGWTHVAALVVDEEKAEAMAFALADNRSGELANWDYERLVAQFGTLTDSGVDLTTLGWSSEELSSLMNSDFTPPPVGEMPVVDGASTKTLVFTAEDYEQLRQACNTHKAGDGESMESVVLRVVCGK